MIIINALRDFADGLTRGLGLYFTERRDLTERAVSAGFAPRKTR